VSLAGTARVELSCVYALLREQSVWYILGNVSVLLQQTQSRSKEGGNAVQNG
jgi:hypothetical protein